MDSVRGMIQIIGLVCQLFHSLMPLQKNQDGKETTFLLLLLEMAAHRHTNHALILNELALLNKAPKLTSIKKMAGVLFCFFKNG